MIITFTTDFGVSSPYVAAMKGALLRVCREVTLVDIAHGIRPQDVRQAAVVLADVTPQFPAGSLHVAVIDPGVGTSRLLLYAEIGEQRYLAPDNGVLSYLARRSKLTRIIALTTEQYWQATVSTTFHGRDKLAPVAGHLARGLLAESLGPAVPPDSLVQLAWNEPQFTAEDIRGEVLTVDSFGNIITNIDGAALSQWGARGPVRIELCGRSINGTVSTYGNERPGTLIALADSQSRLEIAQVNGNAAAELQPGPGEPVLVLRVQPRHEPT
jgi:S-adenosylmethionine hydrolase